MRESLQEEYRFFEHWFFRARREIFGRLLDGLAPAGGVARIVDLGPGSGVNVAVLEGRGRVTVVDVAALSLRDCAAKGARELIRANAAHPPFADGSVDLVCAFDILEHLEHDAAALSEMHRILKPDGHLILSVPAWELLWGRQDVLSEHFRRYHRVPLRHLLERTGFRVERLTYFNALLFAPILAMRVLMRPFLRWTSRGGSDFATPTPFGLERVLYTLFASEAGWLARHDLPIGVSLLAIARPA